MVSRGINAKWINSHNSNVVSMGVPFKKKKMAIAVVLAIFAPLFAYGYLGEWKRGLKMLLIGLGIYFGGAFVAGVAIGAAEYAGSGEWRWVPFLIAVGIYFIFGAWIILDIVKRTRLYNQGAI